MPVNISVTGRPADTAWQNAFELILTVPNYFHPSRNGRERYNNEAGRYAGVQYVDAKLTWATQYRVEEGDSIAMIFIQAEKFRKVYLLQFLLFQHIILVGVPALNTRCLPALMVNTIKFLP